MEKNREKAWDQNYVNTGNGGLGWYVMWTQFRNDGNEGMSDAGRDRRAKAGKVEEAEEREEQTLCSTCQWKMRTCQHERLAAEVINYC